jgi:hypothetical protein
MRPDVKVEIVQKIIKVLDDNKSLPSFFIADRILKEVVEKTIDEMRGYYERLFYTDTDTKN